MPKSIKGPFLLAATRVMRQMDHILQSHGTKWHPGAAFDIPPYIAAMQRLCKEQHLDEYPIDYLRHIARVLEALSGPVELADLKAGERNAQLFEQWLSSTFPQAFADMRRAGAERVRKHALN